MAEGTVVEKIILAEKIFEGALLEQWKVKKQWYNGQ